MRIILIANYLPDNQESMERFAQMLKNGFKGKGIKTEIWRPFIFFGRFLNTTHGIGKWIGYVDKWILFPIILHWRLRKKELRKSDIRFHVCDHSNAPYLKHLPADRSSITCHDVLAIRGALGDKDAYCPASPAGVVLQKWILRSLQRAGMVIATVQNTLDQLSALSLGKSIKKENWHVVPLAFNADFRRIEKKQKDDLLRQAGLDPVAPFLLHVGSALPRKNRKLLIDMVSILADRWNGNICYAGEALEEELFVYAEGLGLRDRIFSLIKPNHEMLVAMYNGCDAFVFPSFSEGFGWPIIEAQACGAPVIASDVAPMPEVSGAAALHAAPTDPENFAKAFLFLKNDEQVRRTVIQKGFENIARFDLDRILNAYLALYGFKPN